MCRHRPIFPGGHPPSIVGTDELNYRVRDGNGWSLIVIDTDLRPISDAVYCMHTKRCVIHKLVTRTRFELVLPA